MRFHCIGVPHTISSKDYVACAFTQKVVKFCKMMTDRGHEVIHYGHEDSDVVCTEHISIISNADLQKAYGNYDWKNTFFKYDINDHAYKTFYDNAIVEIGKRKQRNDFLLPFWGYGVKPICDAHTDLICVEPGIGYSYGHFAPFKIFESYAVYNAYLGLESVGTCKQNWYDIVIPNYFDLDDFDYKEDKEDYFLFLGRVYDGKGVNIAVQVTEKLGAKLIIAGQGSLKDMGYETVPDHVVEIGYADIETRKRLLSNARATFVPSLYNEPFAGVCIESMLSGTPVISTDWGAFPENNIHGLTGYRCRTFEQFVWAAKNIHNIKSSNCRAWAENNFSFDKVASMYEEYFQSLINIFDGNGWYEDNDDRLDLNWLNKNINIL